MNSSIPISLSIASGIILLISAMQPYSFGQGLGFDESKSVLVDNKRISMTLEMEPVFLTKDENVGSAVIRLREINNDSTIPHVTFNVKIIRAGEILLDDRFHSHDGIVAIRFEHVDTERLEVFGNRESIYDAMNVNRDYPAVVRGKVLVGGLYHYKITVLSMWQYGNKLEEPLNFDLYTSIGITSQYQVLDTEEKQRMLSIKTYYEQISDLSYDTSERKVTFTMPLEWDVSYLNQVPFVHEEVHIPNDFAELMSNSYIGMVNDFEVSNRELLIDDYSYENIRTVHFVIGKDKLIRIAKKQSPEQNIAVFTLMPRGVPKFPLDILSAKENFLLQVSWSPGIIEPHKSTKFIVTLRDPKTLDTLRHSSADLVLLKDGKEIVRKHHKAPIGAIVQDHTFTEEETGTILLVIENINNTGESAQLLITVVPEFPLGPFVILVSIVSLVIVITKAGSLNFRHLTK